jgi:hypothetical protein
LGSHLHNFPTKNPTMLAHKMRFFSYILFWLVTVVGAFSAGFRISASKNDYRLPKEFDTFRQLYGETNNVGFSWLSDPRCRVFGRFVVMRPDDKNTPGLYVALKDSQPFPSVMIQPGGENNRPKGFDLRDKDGNTISVRDQNGDGAFDVLFLQSGNILRMDKGLTGTWNQVLDTTSPDNVK